MPSALVASTRDGPLPKRQKLDVADAADASRGTHRESKIFTPYRTIGLVSSTAVPFTSIPLGKTTFSITTSVGRCLQTYDLKRGLQLIFITRPEPPEDITASLAWKDRLFAAWGGGPDSAQGLWVFSRGKKLAELDMPADLHQPIKQILIFGSWIVGCCTTRIEVWKSTTYEHYTTLFPTAAPKGGNELSGGISNMPTYLNKIFAGRKDGGVEIWNVGSGKLIFTILPPVANCGAVTKLQPTPALSLLAIAYSEGDLIIHDIRKDKTIIQLNGGNHVIASISFRTDDLGAGEDGRKPGVMATAGPETGDVTFWDLNNGGRVMGILRGAHNPPSDEAATVRGGVSKVEFLAGQPVIVTSGLDNSLKSWIFNETPYSPIPRMLHSRSGHAAPVTKLLFLPSGADGADDTGKWLLSAGKDRSLWGWSLRKDGQSTELSQGNIRKKAKKLGILANPTVTNQPHTTLEDLKAPEITSMATCLNRDGGMGANAGSEIWQKSNHPKKSTDATASGTTGWESVVTGHRGDKFARTWFWGRKKAGRWAFETGDGGNVSSVAISPCGTFAIVGSETGGLDMFNLQSGMHRQRYPSKLTPAQARKLKIQQMQIAEGAIGTEERAITFPPGLGKHKRAVTGIVVDSLNKNIISCSLDGKIKFWEFRTGNLVDELDWYPMTGITGIRYHASNDLIALSCDDLSIRIVDIETKKTIRELWGSKRRINDFCFSNDGRWIIASSQDCVIRVWDLPTGHLIDAIRTLTQCTALAFSSTGEFLATTCENQLGVNIWNNRTLFTHVPTRHISEKEIATISGPTVSGEGGHNLIDGAFEDSISENEDLAPTSSLDQLSTDMITLSLVPKSRWQNLLSLDLIRQRNKPTEAPKLPEKAPFFLPSLEHPLPKISGVEEQKNDTRVAEKSRIMKMNRLAFEGAFTITLRSGSESGDYTPFLSHLTSLPPSTADLEIRSLQPSTDPQNNELIHFVSALTQRLSQKRDYELVQTWMNVFLRLHGENVALDRGLGKKLAEWKDVQGEEGRRVGELVGYCGGVVGFLRGRR